MKKKEFSKIWLGACIVISVMFTALSYILAALDKNPVSELSIAVIETMWGTSGVSFIGYAIQNSVRAFTASKFGLPKKEEKHGPQNYNCPVCGCSYSVDSDSVHSHESEK